MDAGGVAAVVSLPFVVVAGVAGAFSMADRWRLGVTIRAGRLGSTNPDGGPWLEVRNGHKSEARAVLIRWEPPGGPPRVVEGSGVWVIPAPRPLAAVLRRDLADQEIRAVFPGATKVRAVVTVEGHRRRPMRSGWLAIPTAPPRPADPG